MKQAQAHIVDYLKIELRVSDPDQVHEMQQEISRWASQKLEAMFGHLFEQIPKDKTIVIDRLQFDLGTLSESGLIEQFSEKLQQKIQQKMPDLLHTDQTNWQNEDKEIEQFSRDELYWEVFRHYLLTGTYPWFVSNHTDDTILKDPGKLYKVIFKEEKEALLGFLQTNAHDSDIRKRLIYLLDDHQFEMLGNEFFTGVENYGLLEKTLIKTGVNSVRVQVGVKNVQLALLGNQPGEVDVLRLFLQPFLEQGEQEQFIQRTGNHIGEVKLLPNSKLGISLKNIIGIYQLYQILNKDESPEDIQKALMDFPDLKSTAQYLRRFKNEALTSQEIEALKEEISQKVADKIGAVEKSPSVQKRKAGSKDEESFYVTNGGLILLWPFLPKFFRSLELTADRQFIDKASQVKAVHMLQYLATGERSTYEYVMVLNKVLCGYPIELSFSPNVKFSGYEIEEADELLNSAINQWEALKSTSVQGLRQSFIQRNARLSEQPDQWQLQVESKGYDMLLDKLPWGISVVRLPWMDKPMYVNWR